MTKRHVAWGVIVALSVGAAAARAARAGEETLRLDPAATRVTFTLGATLHTARGSLRLVRGEVRFDPAGGPATGEIVLDARSAETGNATRDANMHFDVLESERHPTITFRPTALEVLSRDETSARVRLTGALALHGEERVIALPAEISAKGGGGIAVTSSFRVPYVDWGVRDVSTFLLRVDRFVDVAVSAEGSLSSR